MFGERNKLTCMYRRARTVYNDANYIINYTFSF